MTDEEAIRDRGIVGEAIARALSVDWDDAPDCAKIHWRMQSDDVREALAKTGFVIVPREPTEGMLAVAGRYNHPRDAEVWRCMVNAAPAD